LEHREQKKTHNSSSSPDPDTFHFYFDYIVCKILLKGKSKNNLLQTQNKALNIISYMIKNGS
jgi:hypothetical protein